MTTRRQSVAQLLAEDIALRPILIYLKIQPYYAALLRLAIRHVGGKLLNCVARPICLVKRDRLVLAGMLLIYVI